MPKIMVLVTKFVGANYTSIEDWDFLFQSLGIKSEPRKAVGVIISFTKAVVSDRVSNERILRLRAYSQLFCSSTCIDNFNKWFEKYRFDNYF